MYLKTCRLCQTKENCEAYKDKFKEYYQKDKLMEQIIKRNIEKERK